MEYVNDIQKIYESMNINTSIMVCDSILELMHLVDALEKKSFPCISLSTSTEQELNEYPNKMIVCTNQEFTSFPFWQTVHHFCVECIFFIGTNSFKQCLDTWLKQKDGFHRKSSQQYIFSLT